MRGKIDIFQKIDNPTHRWNKYAVYSENKDKYDLYFKNRFKVKNGYEKYDDLEPLEEDMVLYQKFDKTRGNNNVVWKYNYPDKVRYDVLNEGIAKFEGYDYAADIKEKYFYSANDILRINYMNLPSGYTPVWSISERTPSKEDVLGDTYIMWRDPKSTQWGTFLDKKVWSAPHSYFCIAKQKKLLSSFTIWSIIDYNSYNGPYGDEVQHGHRSDAPILYDYMRYSYDNYVDWDSPALTRAGSKQYHLKSRFVFIGNSYPETMYVLLSSDLWSGWRVYCDPEDTVLREYGSLEDCYTFNLSEDFLITDGGTPFYTNRGTYYYNPVKYKPSLNSTLNKSYFKPQWNIDARYIPAGAEPENNIIYRCMETGTLPEIFGVNKLYITWTFDDLAISDTFPEGVKYYNHIGIDNTDNYLVKIEGQLSTFKACIWGHGIENVEKTTNVPIEYVNGVWKEWPVTSSAIPPEATYWKYKLNEYDEEQTGWQYYPIAQTDSFLYELDYSETENEKTVFQFRGFTSYRKLTYRDGIVVETTDWKSTNLEAVGKPSLLFKKMTIEDDITLYCAKTWDYTCFNLLETSLSNEVYQGIPRNEHQYSVINAGVTESSQILYDGTHFIIEAMYDENNYQGFFPFKNDYIKSDNYVMADVELGTGGYKVGGSIRFYHVPDWVLGNKATQYYVPPEKEFWHKWISTEIADAADFSMETANYVRDDIFDVSGKISSRKILSDTIRYGFSYPTVSISVDDGPILGYVQRDGLNKIFANIYTNKYYKPTDEYNYPMIYSLNALGDGWYEREMILDNYDYHFLGVASDVACYNQTDDDMGRIDDAFKIIKYPLENYYAETAEWIPIYFIRVYKHNAYDFYSTKRDLIPCDVQDSWDTINPKDILKVVGAVPVWHYDKSKPLGYEFVTVEDYDYHTPDRWLTTPMYYFKAGTMVPTTHFPQMIYEDIHYEDVEYLTEYEKIYSDFGYGNGPSILTPQLPETAPSYDNQSFYRFIATYKEFYVSAKAGSIYVPVGTNPETELYLTNLEPSGIKYDESNLYGYSYAGQSEVSNKNLLYSVETSESFGAYPKDGLSSDGFWYEYIGTDELLTDITWDKTNLRSVPNYNLDINSNQDFTIGDVAGASFTVDVQGNVKDNIRYLGRKCKLYFDFKNQGEYVDFGTFTIDDVKFMNHQVSTITAYDNIKKFDALVYEYLTSDNVKPLYPMTAKTLFQLMCEYCEVPYYTTMDFLNSDKLCYGPFGDANLTARQVLSYIAELAAGYVVCDVNGFAILKTHKPYDKIKGETAQPYSTDYENILPLITSWSGENPEVERKEYGLDEQSSQRMNIFPTEIIDSAAFNNADAETYINYRYDLNAIYDFSDNPFVAFVSSQEEANNITDGILDQIAMIAPYEEARFYSGEIALKEIDMSSFGNKTYVRLLDNSRDLFVPTTININESGITLESKGQPKYSTKIVNSELAKQVDSLKMNIKEIKLTIPDALSDTLDNHGQQITSIESDLGTVQSDVSAVQASVSSLDTALETQKTETNTQFSNVQRRDDGQDDRLDALEAKDTQHDTSISELTTTTNSNTSSISSLNTTVGTHSTSISNLQNTVGGLPTKQYVDDLNQIETINNGLKLKIGEGEISFTANNGYLLISDGTTVWKLKLEVNS